VEKCSSFHGTQFYQQSLRSEARRYVTLPKAEPYAVASSASNREGLFVVNFSNGSTASKLTRFRECGTTSWVNFTGSGFTSCALFRHLATQNLTYVSQRTLPEPKHAPPAPLFVVTSFGRGVWPGNILRDSGLSARLTRYYANKEMRWRAAAFSSGRSSWDGQGFIGG
jgi:hypothetical protein